MGPGSECTPFGIKSSKSRSTQRNDYCFPLSKKVEVKKLWYSTLTSNI